VSKRSRMSQQVVERLAVEFGFDVEEGLACLKRKVKVPFVRAIEGQCDGLKMNGGLFTQCTNKPMATGALCKTCQKQADASGKPTCGLASERTQEGEEWRDPKGRTPTAFGKVMQKEGLNREVVERELTRLFGEDDYSTLLAIPEKVTKKADGEKKQRGRPKKNKEVVALEEGEDLIATLIAQARTESDGAQKAPETAVAEKESEAKKAKKPKISAEEKEAAKAAKQAEKEAAKAAKQAEKEAAKAAKKAEKKTKKTEAPAPAPAPVAPVEELTAESPVDEIQVRKVTLDGVEYLMDQDNTVYDVATQEPIGVWNEATQTIDEETD
jgi:chemotaxis protein histidine kinase CheA